MSSGLENLPDDQIIQTIRELLGIWLDVLGCGGDIEKQLNHKKKFIHRLQTSPIAIETHAANEQHYEVPTEFFLRVLGKKLKYSCCYWPENCQSLDQAETYFFDLIFERAKLQDGLTVLDLGCGWGTTALEVLARYPNSKVVAVSNSRTQREFIHATAVNRGFANRLNVITADANYFVPPDNMKFDRVISVEMFEHMKNYEELLRRVSSWLKDDGILFIHILCHARYAYPFVAKEGSDTEWMAKNFFSGGTMPSADLLLYFQKNVSVVDHWIINGSHYAKTLEAWLVKMDQQRPEILKIFKDDQHRRVDVKVLSESQLQAELENYWRKWRTFFLYCAEVFNFRDGNEWLVAQYLFSKSVLPSSKL